jgi:ubiquinone/menaquinone biosynthesis C-methylase UbiE
MTITEHFRDSRYALLNELRWQCLLGMGIPIKGQTIFEPGAGIGDQTAWLLDEGAAQIIVNDGRVTNLDLIRERFADDERIYYTTGDLETSEWLELEDHSVDLVFLWGVYYHIKDSFLDFPVLRNLARVGRSIVLEFLESPEDKIDSYGYSNPSTSISEYGIRPTMATMIRGMKMHWPHVYLPTHQMDWVDPYVPETPRRIIYGSHEPGTYEGLIEQ